MKRTIQEKVRSMLSKAKAKAIAISIHLINWFPSKDLDKEAVAEMIWLV